MKKLAMVPKIDRKCWQKKPEFCAMRFLLMECDWMRKIIYCTLSWQEWNWVFPYQIFQSAGNLIILKYKKKISHQSVHLYLLTDEIVLLLLDSDSLLASSRLLTALPSCVTLRTTFSLWSLLVRVALEFELGISPMFLVNTSRLPELGEKWKR